MTRPPAADEPLPLTFSRWVAGVIARWRTVVVTLFVCALLAALAVLLIPAVYQARASFVTNSSSGSMKLPAGLSGGALGGIASQLGIGATADPSESPDFYSELIKSRELRTRLLTTRFPNYRTPAPGDSATYLDLLRIRHRDPRRKIELGLKRLDRELDISFFDKTNMVKLKVNTQSPELSAQVANKTLDLVSSFNREQRTSRAQSNRLFLDSRVSRARSELELAEARHRAFYEENRSYRDSPALMFREQQLQREVDRTAELYLLLQRQLETALLEEVNGAALITVVDSAVPPRKAQWPRYGLILISTTLVGGLFGIMIAGMGVVMADWRQRNPASAQYLDNTVGKVFYDLRHPFRRGPAGQRRAG